MLHNQYLHTFSNGTKASYSQSQEIRYKYDDFKFLLDDPKPFARDNLTKEKLHKITVGQAYLNRE